MTGVMTYEVDGVAVEHVFALAPTEQGRLTVLIHGAEAGKLADNLRIRCITAPKGMSQDCTVWETMTAIWTPGQTADPAAYHEEEVLLTHDESKEK